MCSGGYCKLTQGLCIVSRHDKLRSQDCCSTSFCSRQDEKHSKLFLEPLSHYKEDTQSCKERAHSQVPSLLGTGVGKGGN
jgi:hypothetical protein